MEDFFERLAAHFPVEAISWRVGSTTQDKTKGLALAYIDARDVMERLDLICGPAGWQCRYSHANGKTVCDLGVKCGEEWIWKADGAGDTDYEAEKGALSDAFKRAAVRWGIGRYLYGLPSPWVEIDQKGRSFVIKKSEQTRLNQTIRDYTGVSAKSAAQALRDKDFDYYVGKITEAQDMEQLGAVGREIKENIARLPARYRDPLHDAYAKRRDEITERPLDAVA